MKRSRMWSLGSRRSRDSPLLNRTRALHIRLSRPKRNSPYARSITFRRRGTIHQCAMNSKSSALSRNLIQIGRTSRTRAGSRVLLLMPGITESTHARCSKPSTIHQCFITMCRVEIPHSTRIGRRAPTEEFIVKSRRKRTCTTASSGPNPNLNPNHHRRSSVSLRSKHLFGTKNRSQCQEREPRSRFPKQMDNSCHSSISRRTQSDV